MSEVKRYTWHEDGMYSPRDKNGMHIGHFVLASDYDALATQRDEGLAREAELKEQLYRVSQLGVGRVELQQRLAEAEKLPRAVTDVIEIARKIDKEAFAKGTQNVEVGTFRSLAYALERLASPGCVDGEKAE